jgi:hypothetical protein
MPPKRQIMIKSILAHAAGRSTTFAMLLLLSVFSGLSSGCSHHNRQAGTAAPHLTSISVTLGKTTIAQGESEVSTAVAKDQNGATMSGVVFTWASSDAAIATVSDGATTGLAPGTTDITAASGGVTSVGARLTVTAPIPHVTSIVVSPGSATIAVGETQLFSAQAKDQSGAEMPGVVFSWASSSGGVAAIADGTATGVTAGTSVVSASSAGVTSNMAALTVTDVPIGSGGSTTASSEELIGQDLQAGTITEEQGFIYRVYAAFGSPDLPSKYASALRGMIDSPIAKEMAKRYSTLSPEAKAALLPYFSPPIYKGSWGDLDLTSAPSARLQAKSASSRPQEVFASGCGDNTLPSMNADWLFKTTAHFKIWYRTSAPPAHYNPDPFTPEQAEAAAAKIEGVAEEVYDKLTQHFGKVPLSDVNEVCNGGDGLIDIYMTRMKNNALAMTAAFVPGCAERPTWMWISPDQVLNGNDARDVFAHEFMHMIDFAYSRGGDCEEYVWLGEAAGNWAIDFVYHDDQYEQKGQTNGYAPYGTYAPCYYDTDFAAPLEQAAFPYSGCNGYSDYVFLFYLSNKYGPESIRRIFEYAQLYNSLDSLDAALSSAGGLKTVWPDFVTAGWNDWEGGVAGDFYKWDSLKEGRKVWLARDPAGSGAEVLEVDLKGQKEKTILLDDYFGMSSSIEPLGARYMDIKFTDDTARIITFNNNPINAINVSRLAVRALIKINGQWQPPEDWTNIPIKTFCRDAKAERIEELVVMYSSSDTTRPRESSVIFLNDGSSVNNFVPTLAVSNVGCWRWEGTTSLTTNSIDGPVTIESAAVVYDLDPAGFPGLTDAGLSLGYALFSTSAGSNASYSISGTDTATGCSITGSASAPMLIEPNGPVTHHDGGLILNFGLPDPLHRVVIGTGNTIIAGVSETYACKDSSELIVGDKSVKWFSIPQPPSQMAVTVGDDGQSIIGNWTRSDDEGDKVSVWNLHAVREP